MGAILFIVISVLVYGLKIVHNSRHLTYDKWCEIFISFFIFTNCLGFGLPLIELDRYYVDGVFGFKYRLEVYMLITPIFFIVLSKRMKWHSMRIPWYVVLALTVFAAVNIFNPSNVISSSTILAIAQIFSYLLFLYIVCSCVNIDTLLKGIYEGLVYTTLLQLILTICYPILGITAVVELFREGVSIRAAERPGAPGTFNHPNALGGYMAITVAFFAICYMMGFRKQKSLTWGLIAFFVLIFTFSRTALLATIGTTILLVLIYRTRESSIFTIKNIFTLILPMLLLASALIFLTPIKNSFIGSNMDEMMLARMMHYYCGYEIIQEHPFFGLGLNTHLEYIRRNISFGATFGDINKIFWRAEEFMGSNPIHNVPLILLSELGIIGTLPIVYYIIRQFLKIKSRLRGDYNESYKIMALYAVALISYILIHGMADWAPVNVLMRNIWMLVFFAVAIDRYKWEESAPEHSSHTINPRNNIEA